MIFKNYYKLLDLPHNVKSTQNEIKIAYRAQAKKYHPDVNIQNKAAEERFKDISEAYRILSDPIQKKKYDRSWNNYVGKKLHREAMSQKEVRANDIVIVTRILYVCTNRKCVCRFRYPVTRRLC